MSKPFAFLSKKSLNLCEINAEYPLAKPVSIPRHICTYDPKKSVKSTPIETTTPVATKNSDLDGRKIKSNDEKDEIQVIELFLSEQSMDMQEKLYRKRRYERKWTADSDDEEHRCHV